MRRREGARRLETRDVWELARALGIDIESERVRFLLVQPEISSTEAAELLGVSRQAMAQNFAAGVDGARPVPYSRGAVPRSLWFVRPWDLLVWALRRPERWRYVSRERAEAYAAEQGRRLGEEDAVA
jgi:hypothetical protein